MANLARLLKHLRAHATTPSRRSRFARLQGELLEPRLVLDASGPYESIEDFIARNPSMNNWVWRPDNIGMANQWVYGDQWWSFQPNAPNGDPIGLTQHDRFAPFPGQEGGETYPSIVVQTTGEAFANFDDVTVTGIDSTTGQPRSEDRTIGSDDLRVANMWVQSGNTILASDSRGIFIATLELGFDNTRRVNAIHLDPMVNRTQMTLDMDSAEITNLVIGSAPTILNSDGEGHKLTLNLESGLFGDVTVGDGKAEDSRLLLQTRPGSDADYRVTKTFDVGRSSNGTVVLRSEDGNDVSLTVGGTARVGVNADGALILLDGSTFEADSIEASNYKSAVTPVQSTIRVVGNSRLTAKSALTGGSNSQLIIRGTAADGDEILSSIPAIVEGKQIEWGGSLIDISTGILRQSAEGFGYFLIGDDKATNTATAIKLNEGSIFARDNETLGIFSSAISGSRGVLIGSNVNVFGYSTISPGNETSREGSLLIRGNASFAATETVETTLDIRRNARPDRIDVEGGITVGGRLVVTALDDSRVYQKGDTFDLIEAAHIDGNFTNASFKRLLPGGGDLPSLGAGLQWWFDKVARGGKEYAQLKVMPEKLVGFNGFDHFDHSVAYDVQIADHDEPLTLTYTILEGGAQLGTHFALIDSTATSANSGTLYFAAHQTTASIQLQIYNFSSETDTAGDRSFGIDLYDAEGNDYFIGDGIIRSFTYTLGFGGDPDASLPTYVESTTSSTAFVYLSAPTFEGVSINVSSQEQSARNFKDIHEFKNVEVRFGSGSSAEPFNLGIINDNVYEREPEHFDVLLNNPQAGRIEPGHESSMVAIRDDDPIPTLYVTNAQVTVGAPAQFYAYLSNPSQETIVVYYSTYDGSAHDGTDYTGTVGSWTFRFESQFLLDPLSITTIPDYQAGTKDFYLSFLSADYVYLPTQDAVGTILDGQEWVPGYWTSNYEYQNLGHMVSRWVGTHWVEDYYVAGHWDGGNWVEGILTGGDWVAGHYEGGTWVDAHYEGSDWVDAHYEGGAFIAGHYDGGTFVSGHYENGAWVEGAWLNDQWVDGHYEGGTFLAGHMEGQQFVPGHMEGQEFVAGHMENQTFVPGHNETPWIDAVYDENGELVTPGHDGDPYWVGDAWIGGNWVDDAWVGGTWVDDEWTGGTWIDDQWIDQTWVQGYYALQQWIDAHYQQIWVDDHWEGQFWVDDHWENQTWIDGHFANQTWIDAHWENQSWVDGYWINQTWTDGHWENQTWVDAYTAGHWADDYVDEWVDDWQYVWVERYIAGYWITT